MKLKQVDGSHIETDKLPDIPALILERAEELSKLCRDTNNQCFILTETGMESSPHTFISLKTKNTETVTEKEYLRLLNHLSQSVFQMSKGNYCIKQSTP